MAEVRPSTLQSISRIVPNRQAALKLVVAAVAFAAILLLPTPAGLTVEGQRALAVMTLAVVLWATEPYRSRWLASLAWCCWSC